MSRVAIAVYSKHGFSDAHLRHTRFGYAYFGSDRFAAAAQLHFDPSSAPRPLILRVTRPSSDVTRPLAKPVEIGEFTS